MKYLRYALIVLLILFLASCTSRKVIKSEKSSKFEKGPPTVSVSPGDELFSTAERFYLNKTYPEALSAFHKYLSSFPGGPWTAESLLRVADIYAASGKPAQALPYYQRLAAEYPKNTLAKQAELGVLSSLFAIGDYQKSIEMGQIYVKKYRSAEVERQAFEILADAYTRVDFRSKPPIPTPAFWKKLPGRIPHASPRSSKKLSREYLSLTFWDC